jgi:hypothetical protein
MLGKEGRDWKQWDAGSERRGARYVQVRNDRSKDKGKSRSGGKDRKGVTAKMKQAKEWQC